MKDEGDGRAAEERCGEGEDAGCFHAELRVLRMGKNAGQDAADWRWGVGSGEWFPGDAHGRSVVASIRATGLRL